MFHIYVARVLSLVGWTPIFSMPILRQDKLKYGYTNIMTSQYFGKTTNVGTRFATSERENYNLAKNLKELLMFWYQTSCMPNLLNLPMFWLGKNRLATKQALQPPLACPSAQTHKGLSIFHLPWKIHALITHVELILRWRSVCIREKLLPLSPKKYSLFHIMSVILTSWEVKHFKLWPNI